MVMKLNGCVLAPPTASSVDAALASPGQIVTSYQTQVGMKHSAVTLRYRILNTLRSRRRRQ